MQNKKRIIDPIPESFATEEEAGEFWDTHSLADYEEFLEPADVVFEIKKRVFEVRVAEDVFDKLQIEAKSSNQSVLKTVDRILRKELSLAK
jgi:predicted HicB family RNase H-like nuclease